MLGFIKSNDLNTSKEKTESSQVREELDESFKTDTSETSSERLKKMASALKK